MEDDRLQERNYGLLTCAMAVILFLTAAGLALPAFADSSVTVSCYNDDGYVDDIDEVTDIPHAALICNSVYVDCKGNCTACYHDFDYDENICVDSQGRQFLQ